MLRARRCAHRSIESKGYRELPLAVHFLPLEPGTKAKMLPSTDVTAATGRERRAHTRHRAADLPNIRVSRLRHGPTVSLVDLSVGGALVETDVQMRPGTSLTLEIASENDAPMLVPMRVLRCEVASVRSEATIYRGACEFSRPRPWPALVTSPRAAAPAAAVRLDASVRALLERARSS